MQKGLKALLCLLIVGLSYADYAVARHHITDAKKTTHYYARHHITSYCS